MQNCNLCDILNLTASGRNAFAVAETQYSLIVLGWHQYFTGYTLVISKHHAHELHLLPSEARSAFLEDVSLAGEAVQNAFAAEKLNIMFLGNDEPHVHAHIYPRNKNRRDTAKNIWEIAEEIIYADEMVPRGEDLRDLKTRLRAGLNIVYHREDRKDFRLFMFQESIFPSALAKP